MPIVVPKDVEDLVASHVASGRYRSGDDVLRSAMRALAEIDEDLEAIQAAVEDLRSGDVGVPLDEAIQNIRESAPSDAEA